MRSAAAALWKRRASERGTQPQPRRERASERADALHAGSRAAQPLFHALNERVGPSPRPPALARARPPVCISDIFWPRNSDSFSFSSSFSSCYCCCFYRRRRGHCLTGQRDRCIIGSSVCNWQPASVAHTAASQPTTIQTKRIYCITKDQKRPFLVGWAA